MREITQPIVALGRVPVTAAMSSAHNDSVGEWRVLLKREAGDAIPTKNLVIILADTLRHPQYLPGFDAGDLMPQTHAWFRGAARLDNLVASSSWTVPSHLSLLCGRDPWSVRWNPRSGFFEVPKSASLATFWQGLGGTSAIISANRFVNPARGTAPGFVEHYPKEIPRRVAELVDGGTLLNDAFLGARLRRAPPDETYRKTAFFALGRPLHRLAGEFRIGRHVRAACERTIESAPRGKPLFLFLNFMEVHEPYAQLRGSHPFSVAQLPSFHLAPFSRWLQGNPQAGHELKEAYLQAAARLDHEIGETMQLLQKQGILQNSLVILTSDHGQSLGERGFFGHGQFLFDELVRVTALVRFPGGMESATHWKVDNRQLDHRHLHDLIRECWDNPETFSYSQALDQSLEKRGMPATYYEGPVLGSSWLSKSHGGVHRAVRLFGPRGSILVGEGLGSSRETSFLGAAADTAEFEPELTSVLRQARFGVSSQGASPVEEIDERLRSWGYG
jgi:hypothetical protein